MSAQAQLQKPWGMLMPSETNSLPMPKRGHSASTLFPNSLSTSSVFSFFRTVILTLAGGIFVTSLLGLPRLDSLDYSGKAKPGATTACERIVRCPAPCDGAACTDER